MTQAINEQIVSTQLDKLGKDKGGAALMQKQWKDEAERTRREAIEDEEVMR